MIWDNKRAMAIPLVCQHCEEQVTMQMYLTEDNQLEGNCPSCSELNIINVKTDGLELDNNEVFSVTTKWSIQGESNHSAKYKHENIYNPIDILLMVLSDGCYVLAGEDSPTVLMDTLIKELISQQYTESGLDNLQSFIEKVRNANATG
jgi:hypothetical protein